MGVAIISLKKDSAGKGASKVRMIHIALGDTKAEAEAELKSHADACPNFGPAFREDRTLEFPIAIEDLPEGDDDELENWLEDFLLAAALEEADEEEEEDEES